MKIKTAEIYLNVLSMKNVVCQSPTSLRNTHTRLMATKQQAHLNMERKGRSIKKEKLKVKVSLFYSSGSNVRVYLYLEVNLVCSKHPSAKPLP